MVEDSFYIMFSYVIRLFKCEILDMGSIVGYECVSSFIIFEGLLLS